MLVTDLTGGIQFPVQADNSVFSTVSVGSDGYDGQGTLQGAIWWDGGDYIYRQGVSIIPSFMSLPP